MNDIKLLAIRLKKTMFSALLLENSTNPNPDTKAKILQFLPTAQTVSRVIGKDQFPTLYHI